MYILYFVLTALAGSSSARLVLLRSTTLGNDPPTVNHLNGESFQQDALVTFSGEHILCGLLSIGLVL